VNYEFGALGLAHNASSEPAVRDLLFTIHNSFQGPRGGAPCKVWVRAVIAAESRNKAVVAVLQDGNLVRSRPVERVTAKTLKPIVKMTDSSNVSASARTGLKYAQPSRSAGEDARRRNAALISTNSVGGHFAILKQWHYGVRRHWRKRHLGHYLREFDWRYNITTDPNVEPMGLLLKRVGRKRVLLKPPALAKCN
jgi:hypothetical protein